MLLFKARFWPGLRDGSITLTFRAWERARVRVGSNQRTHPIGVLHVDDVREVKLGEITDAEAKCAGFADKKELIASLAEFAHSKLTASTRVFRVQFRRTGEIDRVEGASVTSLSPDDIAGIDAKLDALDERSAHGVWTRATLALIAEHPRVVAVDLAKKVGRERAPFKADVVTLKKLGLTESFEVGYDLTPRGRAYLAATSRTSKKAKPRASSSRPRRAPGR